MTKKQREDLERRQARLAQMGIQIGGNDNDEKQKKKRVVYGSRKNRNKKKEEEQKKRKEEELRKKKEEEERLEKERKEAEEKKRLEAEQKSKDNDSDSSSDDDADGWAANLNSDSDNDKSDDDDDNDDWDANELNLDLNLDDKDEALEEKKREEEEEMRKKEAERQAKAKMKQEKSPKENKKSSNTKKKKKNNKKSKNTPPVTSSNKKKKDDHATLMRNSKERRRRLRLEAKENALSVSKRFRSPIVCVMGHVDTGKTKILDKMRRSNVQDGEAGGITQHIGATQFPADALRRLTSTLLDQFNLECKIPGLLTIDTPGHESFSNLRGRGSSICDIAILVVDIMHGIEPQTAESLRMLRKGKTPFVVALNKVDRCYGWKSHANSPIRKAMAKQEKYTIDEFRDRAKQAILQFNEKGLNAALYWENKSMKDTISLVRGVRARSVRARSARISLSSFHFLMCITSMIQNTYSYHSLAIKANEYEY